MQETWLRSNPRVLWLMAPLPLAMFLAGAVGLVAAFLRDGGLFWRIAAALAAAVGAAALLALWSWTRGPRVAYEPGWLLLYVGGRTPERLPVDVAESFFRGNSPAMLPTPESAAPRTSTVVVRLAEARVEWHQRPVHRAIGEWCGGYITLRGTWCEPITLELLQDLNRRLAAAQRALRQPTDPSAPPSPASTPCPSSIPSPCSTPSPCTTSAPCSTPGSSAPESAGSPAARPAEKPA